MVRRVRILCLVFVCMVLYVCIFCLGTAAFEAPLINPLGDLDEYENVEFLESESWNLDYVDILGNKVCHVIQGDSWVFEGTFPDGTEPFDGISKHVARLGGTTLYEDEYRRIYVVLGKNNETWWTWCECPIGERFSLTAVKSLQLVPGRKLTWKPEDYATELSFLSSYSGTRFQTLRVDLPDGGIEIRAEATLWDGETCRLVYYHRVLESEKSTIYYLDDIPQETGLITWTVSLLDDIVPIEVSFTLEETSLELPPVLYGDGLGILKVRGSSFEDTCVRPTGPVEIIHPELVAGEDIEGELTPQGDIVFWLPSGYWTVQINPEHYLAVGSCETRFVPVSSGQQTIVDMPSSLNMVLEQQFQNMPTEIGGTLDIMNAKETGNDVLVTFMLLDKTLKDTVPSVQNMEVYEGGAQVNIKKVEHVKAAPNVVLLLDSSGSMKGQMEETVIAARQFITSLPDDAWIRVVDFDTVPRLLAGTTKSQVLRSLDTIKANGATALYDSIIEGLDLLVGRERSTLLVFTDGVDANYDDTGPGSKATLEEVLSKVEDSGIPLFTIGFGPKHDNTVLLRLANISGGQYYSAADHRALEQVFAAIMENLGNTYQLTYERPEMAVPGDVPIVSIVVDTSGSMDMPPEEEGCDYRIHRVQNMLHDFILQLPDWCIVQLESFAWSVNVPQVMTSNKPALLQSVGELRAGGGTEILESTRFAVDVLSPIPSTKRILIYVTDAALYVDSIEEDAFSVLLKRIKDSSIQAIWTGLGLEGEEEGFAKAAELSGGQFVVSQNPAVLLQVFADVLNQIGKAPPHSDKTAIRLGLSEETVGGKRVHVATKEVEFSTLPMDGRAVIPEGIRYQAGLPLDYTDGIASGGTVVGVGSSEGLPVSKSIPLEGEASNQAAEFSVVDAVSLRRLRNVDAPSGAQFLGLNLEIENILPVQEVSVYPDGGSHPASFLDGSSQSQAKRVMMRPPYLIPDISSHLFLSFNNEAMYPVSAATWLLRESLTQPGDFALLVHPDQDVRGTCVFVVPDEPIEQLSLHLYDIAYGHMVLPLLGEVLKEEMELQTLPQSEPAILSEAFSVTVRAVCDADRIETVEAGEGSVFRVVEAELTSHVQALLDIDPKQVFSLMFNTVEGDLYCPLHSVTGLLPFGFIQPTMVAPGSFNRVRFAFQIPKHLAEAEKGQLLIDLLKDDIVLPLGDGRKGELSNLGTRMPGDAVELVVNRFAPVATLKGLYEDNWVVADITLIDELDGFGTVLHDAFLLVRDDLPDVNHEDDNSLLEKYGSAGKASAVAGRGLGDFGEGSGLLEYVLEPDVITSELLFGFDNNTAVRDGESRRGLVVFRIPNHAKEHMWSLQSPFFPDLNLPIDAKPYAEEGLLVTEVRCDEDDSYSTSLSKAIAEAIREYQALQAVTSERKSRMRVDLDSQVLKETVPVPQLALYGTVQLADIQDTEKLVSVLKDTHWLPSDDDLWQHRYAPEAVLTQGWGTINDLAHMAEVVLDSMGYGPVRKVAELTPEGYDELVCRYDIDNVQNDKLLAIGYQDSEGHDRVLVLPFMEDIAALDGLVSSPRRKVDVQASPQEATLTIILKAVPVQVGAGSQFGDFGAILAGEDLEDGAEEIVAFHGSFPMDILSLDPVDIGYMMSGRGNGDLYRVVVETATGRSFGEEVIDTGLYKVVGERIEIYIPGNELAYETTLKKGETVGGLFHTLGINLPDISERACANLREVGQRVHGSSGNPDELSALRWYTRNIIAQFVATQSQYERYLSHMLDLTIGRTRKARCLLVTVSRHSSSAPLKTTIDLLQVANDIHGGEVNAVKAFNIFSGLFASRLETTILPGEHMGLFEFWEQLPQGANMLWLTADNRYDVLDILQENGLPEHIGEYMECIDKVVLIPSHSARIGDVSRWAWLEIDSTDYNTIAVLDTGEHGAFIEQSIMNLVKDTGSYIAGALLGVDIAVWSVCTFALSMDDYEEILEAAEGLAMWVADRLETVVSNMPDGSPSLDDLPDLTLEAPDVDELITDIGKDLISDMLPDLGFINGFKDGVGFYFTHAR